MQVTLGIVFFLCSLLLIGLLFIAQLYFSILFSSYCIQLYKINVRGAGGGGEEHSFMWP